MPRNSKDGIRNQSTRPPVSSWPSPRPVTIRISVAMMGWMPNPVMSRALKAPQRTAATSGTSSTTGSGAW